MNILINNNISLTTNRNNNNINRSLPLLCGNNDNVGVTMKKKSSSKISSLINKTLLNTNNNECSGIRNVNRKLSYTTYSNTVNHLINSNNNECSRCSSDNEDMVSTMHSCGSVTMYTTVEVMYTVNQWKDIRNVFININEVYTISSLISMSVDCINECLMEDDKEKYIINKNSAMYSLVMAKKNGLPNYDYPEYDEDMKVKDCIKKKYCLMFKGREGEYLVEKKKVKERKGWGGKCYYKYYNNNNSESDFYKCRSKSSELINASFIQENMKYNNNNIHNKEQSKCILY